MSFIHDGDARPRRHAAAVAATALAVVLTAAGCGLEVAAPTGSTGSTTPMPATEAMAYTATMNADSADVYATYAFSSHDHKIDVASAESGPFSWTADQGQLKTTVTTNGRETIAEQQIIDGNHSYTRISNVAHLPASVTSGIPGLSGWEETTWSGTSSKGQSQLLPALFLFGPTSPGDQLSPVSLLALLRAQASSIQNLGDAVLNGVSTTHYRALVPLSALGPLSQAELQQAEQAFGSSFLSFDYWVDSANLLRQLRFSITSNQPPQPNGTPSSPGQVTLPISYPITISTSMRLSNYGTPVHIVVPPPSEITSHGTCVTSPSSFTCTN
jgi:hypothetical protein